MGCEFSAIKEQLLARLQQKGVDPDLIPGLLRLLANSIFVQPYTNRSQVSQHLRFLGWDDFDLDEHTFQLVTTCFEDENLDSLKPMPASWFKAKFSPHICCP